LVLLPFKGAKYLCFGCCFDWLTLLRFIADLYVHTQYSRATSKEFHIRSLAAGSQIKGVHLHAQEILPALYYGFLNFKKRLNLLSLDLSGSKNRLYQIIRRRPSPLKRL